MLTSVVSCAACGAVVDATRSAFHGLRCRVALLGNSSVPLNISDELVKQWLQACPAACDSEVRTVASVLALMGAATGRQVCVTSLECLEGLFSCITNGHSRIRLSVHREAHESAIDVLQKVKERLEERGVPTCWAQHRLLIQDETTGFGAVATPSVQGPDARTILLEATTSASVPPDEIADACEALGIEAGDSVGWRVAVEAGRARQLLAMGSVMRRGYTVMLRLSACSRVADVFYPFVPIEIDSCKARMEVMRTVSAYCSIGRGCVGAVVRILSGVLASDLVGAMLTVYALVHSHEMPLLQPVSPLPAIAPWVHRSKSPEQRNSLIGRLISQVVCFLSERFEWELGEVLQLLEMRRVCDGAAAHHRLEMNLGEDFSLDDRAVASLMPVGCPPCNIRDTVGRLVRLIQHFEALSVTFSAGQPLFHRAVCPRCRRVTVLDTEIECSACQMQLARPDPESRSLRRAFQKSHVAFLYPLVGALVGVAKRS